MFTIHNVKVPNTVVSVGGFLHCKIYKFYQIPVFF